MELTQPNLSQTSPTLGSTVTTISPSQILPDNSFKDELNNYIKPFKKNETLTDPNFPKTPENAKGLMLSNKNIGDKEMAIISNQWNNKSPLSALFLANNQLGVASMNLLYQMLAKNQIVKHLILTGNQITDFAAAALADLLKVNHYIGWVVLNKTGITNRGAEKLAEALKKNKGIIQRELLYSALDIKQKNSS